MPLSRQERSFLLASFDNIAEALACHMFSKSLPDMLIVLYDKPRRHYHNASHLFDCITNLHQCSAPYDPHVGLALWFHDIVYDPTRHDNEARSADFFAGYARMLRLSAERLLHVQRLILATDHRAPPMSRDEALIMDIDLAILGQSPGTFDAYEYAIRAEYSHVVDADFRRARADILRAFLARPSIYHTPRFHRNYESQARTNLAHSLKSLA